LEVRKSFSFHASRIHPSINATRDSAADDEEATLLSASETLRQANTDPSDSNPQSDIRRNLQTALWGWCPDAIVSSIRRVRSVGDERRFPSWYLVETSDHTASEFSQPRFQCESEDFETYRLAAKKIFLMRENLVYSWDNRVYWNRTHVLNWYIYNTTGEPSRFRRTLPGSPDVRPQQQQMTA